MTATLTGSAKRNPAAMRARRGSSKADSDQRSRAMALPSDVGRGVLPTQRFLSVMPAYVPSNCTKDPLLVPRNANIFAGFQLPVADCTPTLVRSAQLSSSDYLAARRR